MVTLFVLTDLYLGQFFCVDCTFLLDPVFCSARHAVCTSVPTYELDSPIFLFFFHQQLSLKFVPPHVMSTLTRLTHPPPPPQDCITARVLITIRC